MPDAPTRRTSSWLSAVWLVFLLGLSFLPGHYKARLHTKGHLHDAAHFLVFGVFAFLLCRTGRTRDAQIARLLLAAALGLAVELVQDLRYAFPRASWASVEWSDVVVDTMAVVLAGLVQIAILPVIRRGSEVRGSQGEIAAHR